MLPSFPGHARDHTTAPPPGVVIPGVSSDIPRRFRSVSRKPGKFRFSSTAGAPKFIAGAPTIVAGAPKIIAGAPKITAGAPSFVVDAPTITEGAPKSAARVPTRTDRAPPFNAGGLGLEL